MSNTTFDWARAGRRLCGSKGNGDEPTQVEQPVRAPTPLRYGTPFGRETVVEALDLDDQAERLAEFSAEAREEMGV